jgi:L-ribulokinase
MPIRSHKSEQTCAIGAAMFAATAAGLYNRVEDAMNAMGQGFDAVYTPNKELVPIYAKRYERYKRSGAFIEDNIKPQTSNIPASSTKQKQDIITV